MDTSCCIKWKSLGGMNDLDFNCRSFGSSPFLILLFGLIHFKWLKWITIPDDEGHLVTHFFFKDKKRYYQKVFSCEWRRCNLEVSGEDGAHILRSNP